MGAGRAAASLVYAGGAVATGPRQLPAKSPTERQGRAGWTPWALAAGAVTLWSSLGVVSRYFLADLRPDQRLVGVLFFTVVALSAIVAWQRDTPLSGGWAPFLTPLREAVPMGLLSPFLYFLLFSSSAALLPAHETQFLNAAWPLVAYLLDPQRQGRTTILFAVITATCYVLFWGYRATQQPLLDTDLLGILLGGGAALAFGSYSAFANRLRWWQAANLLSLLLLASLSALLLSLLWYGGAELFGAWRVEAMPTGCPLLSGFPAPVLHLAGFILLGTCNSALAYLMWIRSMIGTTPAGRAYLGLLTLPLAVLWIGLLGPQACRPEVLPLEPVLFTGILLGVLFANERIARRQAD